MTRQVPIRALAGLAVFAVLGYFVPRVIVNSFYLGLAIQSTALAMFGLSVAFLMRKCRLITLGHALFFGGGAYGFAIAVTRWHLSITAAVFVSLAMAAVAALVTGALVVRSSGLTFTLLTLALGQMAYTAAGLTSSRDITGGTDGLPFVASGSFFGADAKLMVDPNVTWPVAWSCLVVVLFALKFVDWTRYGELLEAIGENEERVHFLGYATFVPKLGAYVISGVIAALAGIVFAMYESFVTPATLSLTQSGTGLIAALLGGAYLLLGPVLGGFVYQYGTYELAGQYADLYVGIAVVVVIVVLRTGVAGTLWYLNPARLRTVVSWATTRRERTAA